MCGSRSRAQRIEITSARNEITRAQLRFNLVSVLVPVRPPRHVQGTVCGFRQSTSQ